MLTLGIVVCVGWLLAASIGTMAYFANEPKSDESDVQV
jgi:hypothetical protein